MAPSLPALVDDWIRFKRTRTRRGLSVASEAAYRTGHAVWTTDDREDAPWPERDLALVAVLGGAGARASEVIDARVGALRRENDTNTLHVVGKGGKRRTIPVAPEVVAAVDRYLVDRSTRLGDPAAPD